MNRYLAILSTILISFSINLTAQVDSLSQKKLKFEGDFRFRIEHDWDSRNSNGDYLDDRSRLRYRFRLGINYQLDKRSSFGGRLRSGNINDQQGPHVTLGGGDGEFALVQVGFEKLFYEYKWKRINFWVGKNDVPITKMNELFWNDNTYPEGIALRSKLFEKEDNFLKKASLNLGHFIIQSNNRSFLQDSYLQLAQIDLKFFRERVRLLSGFYFFKNVRNIPDSKHTFTIDYSILHNGIEISVDKKSTLILGFEYFQNFENYSKKQEIPSIFKDQKNGFVLSAKYGKAKKKGDWAFHLYYAALQKYAIVDYFAQNDWARWDYSSFDARGSRISNFQGYELRIAYCFKENFNLVLRNYFTEELVNTGNVKERSSRIRLDLNIAI